jgi:hypothetical protein
MRACRRKQEADECHGAAADRTAMTRASDVDAAKDAEDRRAAAG